MLPYLLTSEKRSISLKLSFNAILRKVGLKENSKRVFEGLLVKFAAGGKVF